MKDLKSIILGTGSYDNVKSGNTVSITGDGGNAWNYYGPSYKKLAPRLITYTPYAEKYKKLKEMKENIQEYLKYREEIENEYIKSYYETRLKNLNVYELLNTLYDKFEDNIILLCHENNYEFCHRRVLADYIELNTGIYIPEVSVDERGKIKELVPIRYKDRIKKIIKD